MCIVVEPDIRWCSSYLFMNSWKIAGESKLSDEVESEAKDGDGTIWATTSNQTRRPCKANQTFELTLDKYARTVVIIMLRYQFWWITSGDRIVPMLIILFLHILFYLGLSPHSHYYKYITLCVFSTQGRLIIYLVLIY